MNNFFKAWAIGVSFGFLVIAVFFVSWLFLIFPFTYFLGPITGGIIGAIIYLGFSLALNSAIRKLPPLKLKI